jgi:hypothetical protein
VKEARLGSRNHDAVPQPANIAAEAGHPVGIYPAQIGRNENFGHGQRILRGNIEVPKYLLAEFNQRLSLDNFIFRIHSCPFLNHLARPLIRAVHRLPVPDWTLSYNVKEKEQKCQSGIKIEVDERSVLPYDFL